MCGFSAPAPPAPIPVVLPPTPPPAPAPSPVVTAAAPREASLKGPAEVKKPRNPLRTDETTGVGTVATGLNIPK